MTIGALIQLNYKGKQDIYLTKNPEFNFIQQSYKQYNNFSIQPVYLKSNQDVDFGKTVEFKITKEGDFLHKLYLNFQLPILTSTSGTYAGWTNSLGHALIDYVELELAGQVIARDYGLYLEILNEIEQRRSPADILIGKYEHTQSLKTNATTISNYIIPLNFWFCRNIGASLPLLSLKLCPIIIRFKLNPFNQCIVFDGSTPPNPVSIQSASLLGEFIYMEDTLRNQIRDKEHNYLIQQSQFNGVETSIIASNKFPKIELTFNNPLIEILFIIRETLSEANNDWFNFSKRIVNIGDPVFPLLSSAKLSIDGNDRIPFQDHTILNRLNIFRFHTNPTDKFIYCIPFSNNPELYIPNGTMNFSVKDYAYLYLQMGNFSVDTNVFIFCRSFNIISIKEGLFSLGFTPKN